MTRLLGLQLGQQIVVSVARQSGKYSGHESGHVRCVPPGATRKFIGDLPCSPSIILSRLTPTCTCCKRRSLSAATWKRSPSPDATCRSAASSPRTTLFDALGSDGTPAKIELSELFAPPTIQMVENWLLPLRSMDYMKGLIFIHYAETVLRTLLGRTEQQAWELTKPYYSFLCMQELQLPKR